MPMQLLASMFFIAVLLVLTLIVAEAAWQNRRLVFIAQDVSRKVEAVTASQPAKVALLEPALERCVDAPDPQLALDIMRLFKRFNEVGVTVLIATHDPAVRAQAARYPATAPLSPRERSLLTYVDRSGTTANINRQDCAGG